MNRIAKSLAIGTESNFNGMPQAKLARAMREIGTQNIQGFWKSFTKPEHYREIERDCDVVSRLEYGTLAWVIYHSKSFLIEIGCTGWDNDRWGQNLKIETAPPVCLGNDRALGLRFLELIGDSQPGDRRGFYLIDIPAIGVKTITPATRVELVGRAAVHDAWVSRDCDEMQEYHRNIWAQMVPNRMQGAASLLT